jgi:DegV family protein with EDD domain
MSVSMGLGLQCINAAEMARAGASAAEIVASVEDQARRTRLFGALDTLDHLRKGGRIGAAQALLGSVLAVKPVIEVRNGVVAEAGKVRTRSKSLQYLADRVLEANASGTVYVFHAQAPDAPDLIDRIAGTIPRARIEEGRIGPVIGTHAGPRTIGVGWIDG